MSTEVTYLLDTAKDWQCKMKIFKLGRMKSFLVYAGAIKKTHVSITSNYLHSRAMPNYYVPNIGTRAAIGRLCLDISVCIGTWTAQILWH